MLKRWLRFGYSHVQGVREKNGVTCYLTVAPHDIFIVSKYFSKSIGIQGVHCQEK